MSIMQKAVDREQFSPVGLWGQHWSKRVGAFTFGLLMAWAMANVPLFEEISLEQFGLWFLTIFVAGVGGFLVYGVLRLLMLAIFIWRVFRGA